MPPPRYHRFKHFSNPYFSRPRRRRRYPFVIGALIGTVFGAGVWFAVSPSFALSGRIIEGARPSTAKQVAAVLADYGAERIMGRLRRSHLLLINPNELERRIREQVFSDSVSVSRKWPRLLSVTIRERSPRLITRVLNHYYLTDRKGFVLHEIPFEIARAVSVLPLPEETAVRATSSLPYLPDDTITTTTPTLPFLELPLMATPTMRTSLLGDGQQPFVEDMLEVKNIPGLPPWASLSVQTAHDPYLVVQTTEGWGIRLNSERALREQLDAVLQVINGLKIVRERLDYIDVRFKDRVFYKEK